MERAREGGVSGGPAVELFERERGRLFGIAYRMPGSVREAEDVVQDAWLRWQGVAHDEVGNPTAYLVRLVTRLCIDVADSAHARRMEYVGMWLPEPLVAMAADADTAEPTDLVELAEDLSVAFLLMLERLSPVERAVFVLRESFGYGYAEIAAIVGKTEADCRQIDRRARRRLREGGRPRPADPAEHDRLLAGFLQAARDGDMDALIELLAADVVAYSDGGGSSAGGVKCERRPARHPVCAPDRHRARGSRARPGRSGRPRSPARRAKPRRR